MSQRRVLQVVGRLDRGGVETWLMHVLRHGARQHVAMDFLVHSNLPASYDGEVEAFGSRVIRSPESPRKPWRYARALRRIMRNYGPYTAVHSHVHHFSGLILREAHRVGVPIRIAHSHLDSRMVDRATGALRRLYLMLMHHWIRLYATAGLAASALAAEAMYGISWRQDPRWRVLHYGIDLAAFSEVTNGPAEVRAEFGWDADTFVIGHVGRFDTQKNHAFLVDIAAAVMAAAPGTRLLLIGEGGLRSDVERRARTLGVASKIVMTGVRPDVARLMAGAMDCFVLPSLYEGLPLVLLEAQAAGLPCIVADTVSDEADVIPELVDRLSLAQPVARWAEATLAARGRRLPVSLAVERLEDSGFSVAASWAQLFHVYSA